MSSIPFGSPEIWNCIQQANMAPPNDVQVNVWWKMALVRQVQQQGKPSVFVLFSPNLQDARLQGMITLLKTRMVPSGFQVSDAFFNDKILIVGDFAEEDLLPLKNSPTDLIPIKTKKNLQDTLKQLLG